MRDLLLVCVSLFLPFAAIRAQSDSQQKFSVSGTVVSSADSQPIRGALVELFSSERKTAMTGADGHFAIDGVSAGYANLSVRRPGFDQQNQRPQQQIKISGNLEGITLKLSPLSRISGRVLDREGEPIEGVNIQCLVEHINNGRKQWQPRGGANTDEAGNFALEDLTHGSYILATAEKQLYFVQPKSEAARYVYPPTFYPDSPTRDLAQRIEVTAGSEMKLDMTLHSIRGSRISVTIVPPMSNVMATIGQEGDGQYGRGNQARAEKSGALTFPAVAPGSWKIVARSFSGGPGWRGGQPNEEQMYGELQVEVGGTDIDNLKLPLGKMADIPVTVSGVQNATVFVQLFSKNGMPVAGTNPGENGEMKIRSIAPGTYRVVVPFNGGNQCVTSIMSGSQDLLREELVVATGGPAPSIQVVESSNCAQLSINTNTKENVSVIMTSDNKGFEPRILANGMMNGYVATGLNGGDYKLYAFDDATGLEYTNPDAMREFKSQSVHLDAGQKASVQLEVNEQRPK